MEACFIIKPIIDYKCLFLFYLVTDQITKSDSRLLEVTLVFYFWHLTRELLKSFRKMLCTVADLFTLCSAEIPRIDLFELSVLLV